MAELKHYIFHADWCHHCKTLLATLTNMNQMKSSDKSKIIIGGSEVHLIEQQKMNDKSIQKILGGFTIKGFPTILSITNKSIDEYSGPRDEESLLKHFKKKKFNKGKNKSRYKQKRTRYKQKRTRYKQKRNQIGGTKKRRRTKKNGLLSFLF